MNKTHWKGNLGPMGIISEGGREKPLVFTVYPVSVCMSTAEYSGYV